MTGDITRAEGIIFKAMSGFYYVKSGGKTYCCRARGLFRLQNNSPLVGDFVEFNITEANNGYITKIMPRKNSFIRPAIANLDKLVIIASQAIPTTDPFLIDRMTAISQKKNCTAIVCINKCDIDHAENLFNIYKSSGFTTIKTSAETGDGLGELLDTIKGGICAFTGNSGVGKSSILNRINSDLNIAVGEISLKLGRGRHTTRHIELFKLEEDIVVADTPGFSSFDTDQLNVKEEIAHLFIDFKGFIGNCRFLDCAHINEPGCTVLAALADGKLQKSRHSSYVRLYSEAMKFKKWEHKAKD